MDVQDRMDRHSAKCREPDLIEFWGGQLAKHWKSDLINIYIQDRMDGHLAKHRKPESLGGQLGKCRKSGLNNT